MDGCILIRWFKSNIRAAWWKKIFMNEKNTFGFFGIET